MVGTAICFRGGGELYPSLLGKKKLRTSGDKAALHWLRWDERISKKKKPSRETGISAEIESIQKKEEKDKEIY